jgi:hypothetical protein
VQTAETVQAAQLTALAVHLLAVVAVVVQGHLVQESMVVGTVAILVVLMVQQTEVAVVVVQELLVVLTQVHWVEQV